MACIVIAVGAIEAFISSMRAMFSSPTGHERRDIWLRFRSLVDRRTYISARRRRYRNVDYHELAGCCATRHRVDSNVPKLFS
jgi:hypothetical protein